MRPPRPTDAFAWVVCAGVVMASEWVCLCRALQPSRAVERRCSCSCGACSADAPGLVRRLELNDMEELRELPPVLEDPRASLVKVPLMCNAGGQLSKLLMTHDLHGKSVVVIVGGFWRVDYCGIFGSPSRPRHSASLRRQSIVMS